MTLWTKESEIFENDRGFLLELPSNSDPNPNSERCVILYGPVWSTVAIFVIGQVQLLKLMDFVLCQFLFEDMIAAFDKILNLLGL